MNNPWEKIDLNIYEEHMSSDKVLQLQTLSSITKQQLNDYEHTNVIILGVAGGNGLEHIDIFNTKKVYGIDVNKKYLDVCKARYRHQLANILELICCDASDSKTILPFSNILICNLIIEYLGVNKFIELIQNNIDNVNIVSCVIQKNNNTSFVSNSSLTSAFDPILSIHNDIDSNELLNMFLHIGLKLIKSIVYPLSNDKTFIRMDFKKSNI